ncbi:hypothetical protein AVEN_205305-1 [Araneus ventricosus]|uniref:Uncharacterized protein n=1 Tax=Araneus ventricosus TaxID=182803 RepID=A0A4Y2K7F1_ARAVE|nr:hypothetical protein AVEN_205305-1 [Araneus ventricosus]
MIPFDCPCVALLTFSESVGHAAPEGSGQELDERPDADEEAALGCVHAHLLEVDGQQGEERPERREEEEVEGLGDQQVLVEVGAQTVDDVALGPGAVPARGRVVLERGHEPVVVDALLHPPVLLQTFHFNHPGWV